MYAARPSLFYCSQPRWLLNQFIFSVILPSQIVSYGGWFLPNTTGQRYISNTAVCFANTVNLTIVVLKAATMKIAAFLDVTPFSLVEI